MGLRRPKFGEETAASEFNFESADGGRRRVRLRVGRPYQASSGEWACPVEFRGLEPRYPDIRGEGSLQALCLAITLLRERVENVIANGGKLLYVEDGTEWDKRTRTAIFGGFGFKRRRSRMTRR